MDFYRRVSLVCRRIPYGKTATYGQIALLCGKPRNSRQVGYALHHRLEGEKIPVHRVVNREGYLSGAQAFDGPDTQRLLLLGEGVEVSPDNRVALDKFGWKNTMEDALQLKKRFEEEGI